MVPIPNDLADSLRSLKVKGTKDGRNYWFWTCQGKLTVAVNNWRDRVQTLLDLAQKNGNFTHPAHPHTFRHTFSVSHLNNGVDIKTVSRWLGHTSIKTTEKHYSHAILGTHLASERAYDLSMATQASNPIKPRQYTPEERVQRRERFIERLQKELAERESQPSVLPRIEPSYDDV